MRQVKVIGAGLLTKEGKIRTGSETQGDTREVTLPNKTGNDKAHMGRHRKTERNTGGN